MQLGSFMAKEASDWMRLLLAVYADGEWVESDSLWSDEVGGMVRRALSQKVQTYKFAATGAGVQLC